MSVLTFHFLSFKLLTLLLVSVGAYSRNVLSQWPLPSGHTYNNLWLLYTLVGVVVLVLCFSLIKKIGILTCVKR